ncbi:MAG: hypothetical protein HY686_02680 [Chloroflexi bacterium]|nr:hypothetical protein [Chloroflexota bacterium]
MDARPLDPLAKLAYADALVQRTAEQLAQVLHELASALDPFPAFLGMPTIQAVEVEPQGPRDPELGCVVVCPDGELYELNIRLIPGPPDIGGVDQVEEFKPLQLAPSAYVAYAHCAIASLARLLLERQARP